MRALEKNGCNILYRLPTLHDAGIQDNDTLLPTFVDFGVSPFIFGKNGEYAEGMRGRQKAMSSRNVVVFYRMYQGQEAPEYSIPTSWTRVSLPRCTSVPL